MAVLTVQDINQSGLNPVLVAANVGGDSIPNEAGNSMFRVKNGGGASTVVTVNSVAPCSHGFDHDLTITVLAGEDRLIGPFPRSRFNDTNSQVGVTYSVVTSVTVAVLRFTPANN